MKRILLLIILAWLSIPISMAQDLPTLTYGTPGEFEITGADAVSFTFEGTAGDLVYITQHGTSGDSEATMRVFSSKGALVAELGGLADGEFIEPMSLPDTGRYTVSMQRPDWSSFTGGVTVLVDTATIQEAALPLDVTASFGGDGQVLAYSIQVEKNTLFAWLLDCEICFAALKPPASDDWMVWGLSDYLEMPLMLLAEPGTYTFYIQNRAPGSEYHLKFGIPEPAPLTANEPVTGKIDHFQTLIFTFDSAAGKVWQLNSSIPDGGRRLEIVRLQGRSWWDTGLDQDDGSGPGGNARIKPFIAPEDGTYYVLLRWNSWSDDLTPPDYTITLQPDTLRQLAPGTTFTGDITVETGNVQYLYDGKAGEALTLTLERTSETGAFAMGFYGPSDEVASFNGRSSTRVEMDVVLPEDGRYQVVIADIAYDNTSGMSYSIKLEAKPEQ